jgi:hypothetical protein
MVPAVFIIDDFLNNAEAVREQALSLTYKRSGLYAGHGSVETLTIGGLERVVSSIVQQRLVADWPPDHAHATCRLTLAEDDAPAPIHVDPNHLSGILYLSRDEDCRGGTEFWRHKRTGTDRMPMGPDSLRALGYASYAELEQDILTKEGWDRSKWEHAMTVPMRFNRLVLLQPQYWHTAGPGFGDSIENGRLIYLMFFNRAPVQS